MFSWPFPADATAFPTKMKGSQTKRVAKITPAVGSGGPAAGERAIFLDFFPKNGYEKCVSLHKLRQAVGRVFAGRESDFAA